MINNINTKHMKKTILSLLIVGLFVFAIPAKAEIVGGASVQTNSAINISNYQATLQGNLIIPYISNTNYIWFQWGNTNGYGNETARQSISYGSFNQTITGLSANATYHFRAVAQINSEIVYGQDMTFYTSGSNYYNMGSLTINKKVINLSSGNLNWSEYVSAKPYDVLSFSITMQANGNQDVRNVYVQDILPANLIYKGNLTINANLNYSGNPVSGMNIGTIPANGIMIIAYQAQVAGNQNFNYGNTTLTNTATITSNETGSQTDSATVFVTNSSIAGATDVITGITNNFLVDSFFLPLMIILLSAWLYFSKKIYNFADWLKVKIKR